MLYCATLTDGLCCVCVCVCVCVSVCGWFSLSVMPDSLWSHGLLCSWNCPGKNTGVGSHSLLHSTFLTHGSNPDLPHRRLTLYYLSHQGSPKNTGVGIHSLLQGRIFPTQGSNSGLLPCRQILYQLNYEWSPCFVTQSCPTLYNPMDCSLPGSSVCGNSPCGGPTINYKQILNFMKCYLL